MGRMGRFDCKGLKDFQQQLGKLQNPDDFVESCAKELAARLLRMVVKRTPVGQYPASSGKKGGTLRRGWTGEKRASAQGYADSLTVNHFGDTYVIEIPCCTRQPWPAAAPSCRLHQPHDQPCRYSELPGMRGTETDSTVSCR